MASAGSAGGSAARRFGHQPLEAPLQHLAHHAEVVARRELRRADVELAILVLPEALRPGDDHRADRVRALDVAVVVDLDALRHARQAERLGEPLQQLLLRRGVGELAAERLARIDQRMRDQLLLLAPLRHRDLDPAAGLGAQRLGQQFALGNVVRQQDQRGRRLVVVELREERAQHLARSERAVGLAGNTRDCPSSGRCGRRTPRCR